MRLVALSFIAITFSVTALAQDPSGVATSETKSRKMYIKELVSQGHGEISAIEPSSNADGSAVIGYASGDLLVCGINQSCKKFGGTPSVPVEHIAVAKNGASETIWVSYRQGALYLCTNNQCEKFMRHDK